MKKLSAALTRGFLKLKRGYLNLTRNPKGDWHDSASYLKMKASPEDVAGGIAFGGLIGAGAGSVKAMSDSNKIDREVRAPYEMDPKRTANSILLDQSISEDEQDRLLKLYGHGSLRR